MNLNFEFILFCAISITGLISLIDYILFARKRTRSTLIPAQPLPVIVDYARSFFPVLLGVFLLRSFFFEPFRIPSGSLQPTLLIGDFILVNKFHYGIRLPIIHQKIIEISVPKRGDIIVLRWPPKPSVNFIKRIIGLPGDHISYIHKVLYINGQMIPQTGSTVVPSITPIIHANHQPVSDAQPNSFQSPSLIAKKENLLGIKHWIHIQPMIESYDYHHIIVPKQMYFVMGDNRDDSADSRYWGFVPEENIVGKATLIWMSWNNTKHTIRWNRLITRII